MPYWTQDRLKGCPTSRACYGAAEAGWLMLVNANGVEMLGVTHWGNAYEVMSVLSFRPGTCGRIGLRWSIY